MMLDNSKKIIDYLQKNNLPDLTIRPFFDGKNNIYLIYLETICSSDTISDFISRPISKYIEQQKNTNNLINYFKNILSTSKLQIINTYDDLEYYLFNGFTIIIIDKEKEAIAIETKASLDRSISESSSEATVFGPKDSFTENYQKNLGLIRKRIKTKNLYVKEHNIGRITKTKVGIIYINDIVKKDLIKEIEIKLKQIDIDGILDSSYIKAFIKQDNKSVFPTINGSEKPDLIAGSLLEGRVCIMVENSPYVIIIPSFFIDFFHASDDYYQKSFNISLTRIIRLIGFFIALLTPALYIAIITYNQEIIPTNLLISFATQREAIPFPAFIEVFIMALSFEILRESNARVPSVIGGAVSTVGAIVVGETAVSAGFVSTIMVIVIAITSVSSLLFSSIDMINGLRWWRLFFMVISSFLGVIGITLGLLYFVIKLSSIKTFGIPYIRPLGPTYIDDFKDSFIKFPRTSSKKRSKLLTKNIIRLKEE